MTFLLDVNVLMALLWENHEHHQVARAWLRHATGFATCPVSQLGFARVSSHSSLGYSMSPDQAFSVLRAFLADERHHRFTLATFDESLARAFVEECDLVQLVH